MFHCTIHPFQDLTVTVTGKINILHPVSVDSGIRFTLVVKVDAAPGTALQNSPDSFQRWGFPQGQGNLVGATLGELPVPKAINSLAGGELDAAGAAERAAEDVKAIQKSLG